MKKRIILAAVIAICVVIITVFVYKYKSYENKVEGNFFRQLYGSIGISDCETEYTFRIDLLNYNCSIDFLGEADKLSFDNINIDIVNVGFEKQSEENDLKVYSVYITVGDCSDGIYDVSKLIYNNGDKKEEYPIGKLSFVYQRDNEHTFLTYGCDTAIVNNKASFTFLESNERNFEIVDVILAEQDNVKYNYKKNVSYKAGQGLLYEISVEYTKRKGDMFVMQPIFVIKFDGKNDLNYFAPGMLVFDAENLTYIEMRDYVQ